ncbi:MAG: hypothetical protein DUD27_03440 [Lachnospiraceae bacterium]|uniref:AlgX/AlgJ SGNH hydrolase-like domain-containing protein n=1 Tax=Candidatus Weimeria bifida TaxID=2599074 RepID=A0A6N7IXZ4_9FIRM|nr:hypothetical protein [Candidatus Weimeria bifida]RRF96672.1 MAG: hypothetical protein DUD27_03440 [Lachnospiraceae bacterium]
MKKRSFSIIFIIFIFLIVLTFCAVGIFGTRPAESVNEKRKLAKFPTLTVQGLLNGKFYSGLQTWYADTYPLRETMIAKNSDIQDHYGIGGDKIVTANAVKKGDKIPVKKKVTAAKTMKIPSSKTASSGAKKPEKKTNSTETKLNDDADSKAIQAEPEKVGSIYIAGGSGFSLYYFNRKNVDTYASMVNTVAERLGSSVNVYAIPTPDSFGAVLSKKTQEKLSQYEGDAFDYIYKRFAKNVNVVEVYNELRNHSSEYIYFRTDHHWTARGAYYAYRQFCRMKGFTPHELGDYKKQVSKGFLGTYYSFSRKSPELQKNPDTIEAYIPISTNTMTMTDQNYKKVKYKIIQPGKSYSVFIGGDEPLEEIDNPKKNDGSACVLIKDSYGCAFAPFLVDHYDKTYIVDFRYYRDDLTQMIKDKKIKDVIFLNNVEFITQSNSEKILSLFKFDRH